MRVLIATNLPDASETVHGQLGRTAVDGELVAPTILECADRFCDTCRRGWFGLSTHRSTITAMVVERQHLAESQLRQLIHEWLDCQGTIDAVMQAVDDGEFEVGGEVVVDPVVAIDDLITDHVEEMRTICEAFPVGTVLSRMGSLVSPRVDARAAA
ncbi:MAG TPA: hypothetical protein VMM60_00045 [Ilumatobacter sp.]|nr:hypothetical protein [Ilumatobacter sp.]